jgi:calpain-7
MELEDLVFREIRELEEQAYSGQLYEERLESAIKAVELASKHCSEWLDPLGRKELYRTFRRLLPYAERLKKDDSAKPDAFQLEALVDAIIPVAESISSSRELPKKEQILLLTASKFGGSVFPPWSREPTTKDFNESASTVSSKVVLSKEHQTILHGWERVPSLYSMVPKEPCDFIQDMGMDCSIVASICSLMSKVDTGQSILAKMLRPFDNATKWPFISKNGHYWFRFYFNGTYRRIMIDDKLPVTKSGRILHIIDRNNPSLLWPALLEKAYLQLWGGYDFLGSNSNTDLFITIGWIPELIILSE